MACIIYTAILAYSRALGYSLEKEGGVIQVCIVVLVYSRAGVEQQARNKSYNPYP